MSLNTFFAVCPAVSRIDDAFSLKFSLFMRHKLQEITKDSRAKGQASEDFAAKQEALPPGRALKLWNIVCHFAMKAEID